MHTSPTALPAGEIQTQTAKCMLGEVLDFTPLALREGRAAKRGAQVRPLGNVNCENMSSDCKQLTVSLQHALEPLGQPAGQSSSQEEGADGKPWWGNLAFQAGNSNGDLPCSASLELHLNVLICATLPLPRSPIIQRYLPSADKKAYISHRLHSAHRCSCKVTTSPLLSSTE